MSFSTSNDSADAESVGGDDEEDENSNEGRKIVNSNGFGSYTTSNPGIDSVADQLSRTSLLRDLYVGEGSTSNKKIERLDPSNAVFPLEKINFTNKDKGISSFKTVPDFSKWARYSRFYGQNPWETRITMTLNKKQ